LGAGGTASITAEEVDNGSNDSGCGGFSLSVSPNSFNCSDVGSNSVTLTITDNINNTASCNATVTVEDNIAPVAGCQNVTVQLDANGQGSTTPAAVESGSTDNCGTINAANLTPNTFDCQDLGGNLVTLTINDGNGNNANCNATVTVEDNIPPMPVCKTETVELQPDGMYTLQEADVFDANASSDNCSIDIVSFPTTTYDCDDKDQTFTVGVTVTDAGGNMASCDATITVVVGKALPSEWSTDDIGNSGTLGNEYCFDPCAGVIGEFTITGGGNNAISSTTDNVAFANQYICDQNVSITAKIESVDAFGYGGLMIRELTTDGAKQAAVFSNLTNILRHEVRYTNNGPKQASAFYKPAPIWLRLLRQGDWIFAYYSTTGVSFQYVHGVYVPMNNCVHIGLASFTYLPNQQTSVVFSNVTVATGAMMLAEVPELPEAVPTAKLGKGVSLFPNPTSDVINLVFEESLNDEATVTLRNQSGQAIEQRQLQADIFQTDWDVSNLPDGVYFIEIHRKGQAVEALRFVKSK